MAKSPGKRFERELKASMELAGFMVERIPDGVYWDGRRMASNRTPADFHAWIAGSSLKSLMIEAKASGSGRFEFSRLESHQMESLAKFESIHKDALGYVALNFYDPANLRVMNRCYMVPINVWVEYAQSSERKSLPLSACEEDGRIIFCPRMKGSMYDMSGFVLSVNSI